MKKYLYLLVAVVCMGFAGCGGSDDDDNGSSVLNGTWTCSITGGTSLGAFTLLYSYTFNNGVVKYIDNRSTKLEGRYTVNEELHVLTITWERFYKIDEGGNWLLIEEGDDYYIFKASSDLLSIPRVEQKEYSIVEGVELTIDGRKFYREISQ